MEHLLITVFAAFGGILLIYLMKKRRLRWGILSALTGLAGLFAADLLSGFFDFNIPMNVLSLSAAAIGGIPGVILINLLNVMFR